MELLIQIPFEFWPHLRDMYKDYWPQGSTAYCLLDMQISHPKLRKNPTIKVYCPQGDMAQGMVAISDIVNYYRVMIHPAGKDTSQLEEALLTTQIIDWKRDIIVPSADPDVTDMIKRLGSKLNFKITGDDETALQLFLSNEFKGWEEISAPPNTYVGPLKPEYLAIVDQTWRYHSAKTHEYFNQLIKNDLTYVLYSEAHEPLAWINVDFEGAFSHLFCLENYRRKGYAEFITKYAANDLLKKGKNLLAYTHDNEVARVFFKKLGFVDVIGTCWLFLKKYD